MTHGRIVDGSVCKRGRWAGLGCFFPFFLLGGGWRKSESKLQCVGLEPGESQLGLDGASFSAPPMRSSGQAQRTSGGERVSSSSHRRPPRLARPPAPSRGGAAARLPSPSPEPCARGAGWRGKGRPAGHPCPAPHGHPPSSLPRNSAQGHHRRASPPPPPAQVRSQGQSLPHAMTVPGREAERLAAPSPAAHEPGPPARPPAPSPPVPTLPCERGVHS